MRRPAVARLEPRSSCSSANSSTASARIERSPCSTATKARVDLVGHPCLQVTGHLIPLVALLQDLDALIHLA